MKFWIDKERIRNFAPDNIGPPYTAAQLLRTIAFWQRMGTGVAFDVLPFDAPEGAEWQKCDYRGIQSLGTRFRPAEFWPAEKNGKGGGGAGGRPQRTAKQDGQKPPSSPTASGKAGRGGVKNALQKLGIANPGPAMVTRAIRAFSRMLEEENDEGAEIAPRRWDYGRLVTAAETGNPFPARRWEKLSLPIVLIGVDNSGSIGNDIAKKFLAVAMAASAAFPQIVVVNAWNAECMFYPFSGRRDDDLYGWRGDKPFVSKTVPVGYRETNLDDWRELAREVNARWAIHLGDMEQVMAKSLAPIFGRRFVYLSNMSCNFGPPVRQAADGYQMFHRVGDVEAAMTAIEMAVEWARG